MVNKLLSLFLACLFLTGSILLPLSDFSLIQDIPGMYQNYSHITTVEELGVIDFIGDYLLDGKEMFGHNKQDKQQNNDNNVQFQHQANSLNVVFSHRVLTVAAIPEYDIIHPFSKELLFLSEYPEALLRPPLV